MFYTEAKFLVEGGSRPTSSVWVDLGGGQPRVPPHGVPTQNLPAVRDSPKPSGRFHQRSQDRARDRRLANLCLAGRIESRVAAAPVFRERRRLGVRGFCGSVHVRGWLRGEGGEGKTDGEGRGGASSPSGAQSHGHPRAAGRQERRCSGRLLHSTAFGDRSCEDGSPGQLLPTMVL